MKVFNLIFLFCFVFLCANAQTFYQDRHFIASYFHQGEGKSVSISGEDNATYLASSSWEFFDYQVSNWVLQKGCRVYKLDKDGNVVWDKTYMDPVYDLEMEHVYQSNDGGYLVVGNASVRNSIGTIGYILKVDANGNKQWSDNFSASTYNALGTTFTSDGFTLNDAVEMPNGEIAILGTADFRGWVYDPSLNSSVLKYTRAALVIIINRTNNTSKHKYYEFEGFGVGLRLKALENGNLMALLQTEYMQPDQNGNMLGSLAATTMYLKKDLSIIWESSFTFEDSNLGLEVMDFDVDNNLNVSITGTFGGNINNTYLVGAFLSRLNNQGAVQWTKFYNWSGNMTGFQGRSIARDGDGKLYIGGLVHYSFPFSSTDPDAYVLKTDFQGNPIRVTNYGKEYEQEYCMDIDVFSNGVVVGTGYTIDNVRKRTLAFQANQNGFTACDSYQHELSKIDYEVSDFSFFEINKYEGTFISSMDFAEFQLGDQYAIVRCQPFILGEPPVLFPLMTQKKDPLNEQSVISPNPGRGVVQIQLGNQFDTQQPVQANLFGMDGRFLKGFQLNSPSERLTLPTELEGLYLLRLEQGQIVENQKLVIQK